MFLSFVSLSSYFSLLQFIENPILFAFSDKMHSVSFQMATSFQVNKEMQVRNFEQMVARSLTIRILVPYFQKLFE